MIVDAKNQIAGRLASNVAKNLLKGEKIVIINAEHAVVSGKPKSVMQEFETKVKRGDPYHGPFYPKQPDLILRRMIRGMLQYKTKRGIAAMKSLRVHVGVPAEFANEKPTSFKGTDGSRITETKLVPLGDISVSLGVRKRW